MATTTIEPHVSRERMRELLQELERRKRANPWYWFKPIPILRPFHESLARIRLIHGPNRGGKTTTGAAELASYLMGWNRWRKQKIETPNLCWAVALDNKKLGFVQKQRLRDMLPPNSFREWRADGIWEMYKRYGGSQVHFMSCESGPTKFQAQSVRAVWFDEEPRPKGMEIFNETYSRMTPGQELDIWITLTPTEGYTWSRRRLLDTTDEDYLWGPDGERIVESFNFSLQDCHIDNGGFLTQREIDRQWKAYRAYERNARFYGLYDRIGGSPAFDPDLVMEAQKHCPTGKRGNFSVDGATNTHLEYNQEGAWLVFEEREPYERYIMGIDVSGGGRRDRSVAYVIKKSTRARVARFKANNVDPERFAREFAYPALRYYNNATAVPEINADMGGAFLQSLKFTGYGNIWNEVKWDETRESFTAKQGWRTHRGTRGIIIASLERALREGLPCFTGTVLDEIAAMQVTKNERGEERVEHPDGCYDDEAIALGIALAVSWMDPYVRPQRREEYLEEYHPDPYLEAVS